MGKVVEIGIGYNKGEKIQNVNKVEAIKGQGLLNDRKFAKNSQKESQITLIEIENIYYFNNKYKTTIPRIFFIKLPYIFISLCPSHVQVCNN